MSAGRTLVLWASLAALGCGGAAERWAALEAEGLPGGPDDAPPLPVEDEPGPRDDDEPDARLDTPARRDRTARRAPTVAEIEPAASAEPRRLERRVAFVRWTWRALEPRLLAQRLRERHPALVECARAAGVEAGFATITLAYPKGERRPRVSVDGELATAVGACVKDGLKDLELEGAPGAPAELAVAVRVVSPGAGSTGLPEIGEAEELAISEGRCVARERFGCKKPGTCSATVEREVRCPEEHGLLALLEPADASERIELVVSGGAAGSGASRGTHTLVYALAADRCSLTRIVDEPSATPPVQARETVDASCAAFDEARSIFAGKLADKKVKAKSEGEALTRRATHWKKRGAGEKPSVREVAWAGTSEEADAAFDRLRAAARGAGRGAAKLRSSRLDD